MYIRLSREDDCENESESVTNQRSYILDYLKENNYTVYEEYVDDGFSGTRFEDRPAFMRMIQDIKEKNINMVVTKDLSRLGRDYITTGHYIEKFFPENNVRYIAINDNVDSLLDNGTNELLPFKAVINDMYAKDISNKVKSAVETKKKQGLFLGSIAPYGYMKDPDNKYKLIIDSATYLNVKRIYNLYLNGTSIHEIARIFTREKITKPNKHMKRRSNADKKFDDIWDIRSISDILRNPNYTGDLYQSKTKKLNYKSKKVIRKDIKEWIKVENTHEAIIDKKTFNLVQNINKMNENIHRKKEKKNFLLQGLLYCKECNHTIGIKEAGTGTNKRSYTSCNHYKKNTQFKLCTPHSMRYENLEKEILLEIKKICKKYLNTNKLEDIVRNEKKKNKLLDDYEDRVKSMESDIKKKNDLLHNMYLDKLNNVITLTTYREISEKFEKELIDLKQILSSIIKERDSFKKNNTLLEDDSKKIVETYLSMKKADRNLLANIIDKIYIDKDKNVEIKLKIRSSL